MATKVSLRPSQFVEEKPARLHCPECGGSKLVRYGTRWSRRSAENGKRVKVQRYQCNGCGNIFKDDVREIRRWPR